MCDENAECLDTQGSFECTCHSGYTGDGDTCLDVDECLTDPCDKNATCTNNNGSFSCHCHPGFMGDGTLCTRKCFCIIMLMLFMNQYPQTKPASYLWIVCMSVGEMC